jgi:stearoyl-CoA desaturase (delta-9 desaturase)
MFKLDSNLSIRSTIDLMRDPDCAFLHKHYHKILWTVHGCVAFISVDIWLYSMLLPAFIGLHSFAINTSLNHYRSLGYTNYTLRDNSINSPWVFPLILGEAWHNNHHGDPKNGNYGGRHWWELDPTWWLIKLVRVSE